jgi:hypothetical protein
MKHLVGKKITKKIPFMDSEVELKKLSVKEVQQVQKLVKANEKNKDENSQIKLLTDLLKISVIGADELSDEEFSTFPIGDLTFLSEEIMSYSGLSAPAGEPPKGN